MITISNSIINKYVVLWSLFVLLASCFDQVNPELKQIAVQNSETLSQVNPTNFTGAIAARNKVTGIEVSWTPASIQVKAYRVYRVQGKELTLLATLTPETYAFIDGTAWWGSIFSYIVRAVDLKEIEDNNFHQVSALSWPGIQSVTATSRTSLIIRLIASNALIDEVRIYVRAGANGEKILAATATGSDVEIPLQDLKPGYQYLISAQAYVSSLKKEDQNEIEFSINTNTLGYHSDGADQAKWANVINVRAFGESSGTSPHPTTPDKSPSARLVELAFNSFYNQAPDRKYVVIRTKDRQPMNTQTTKTCNLDDIDSCKVCDLMGSGTLTCFDRNAAPSPMRYRYTMAIVHESPNESWVEPLPESLVERFSILVPIPPANMVLVQRDAVNYEMCEMMNKLPDAQNFNRCPFQGPGAVPYSTGHNKPPLNLPNNFYDFGYNLFVDRYVMACNWTRQADGGRCGTGGSPGDCLITRINQVALDNSLGVDGNVLWTIENYNNSLGNRVNRCYIKVNGVWSSMADLNAAIGGTQYLQQASTNDPARGGGKRPEISSNDARPTTANLMCNSHPDPTYGPKRIPRRREHIAFTAWSTLPNEPYYRSLSNTQNLINGLSHDSNNGYRCFRSESNSEIEVSSLAELLQPNNFVAALNFAGSRLGQGDFIGSPLSSDCQSRYGVHQGRYIVDKPVSDVYLYEVLPIKRFIGALSPIDDGNRDLLMDISGIPSGYKILMSDTVAGTDFYSDLNGSNGTHNFVNLALGLPVFLSTSSDYLAKAQFPGTTNGFRLIYTNSTTNLAGLRQIGVSERYRFFGNRNWNDTGHSDQIRCVLPAE
jgi:hypothetical protein